MTLMEGLTVLSTDTTAVEAPGILIALGVIAIMLGIIAMALSITVLVNEEAGGVLLLFPSLLVILLGICCFCEVFKPEQTIYKVIIDESVSMIEFNKRYEILDQDGLIYEIVEKGK